MALFSSKKSAARLTEPQLVPEHIGIIMDGNGRWAKKRGLPRQAGHVTGAKVFRTIAKHCEKRGIKVATFYTFSTENWKRPQEEVDAIMNLLREYLKESLADFKKENIRTRFIGDRSMLAPDIQELMAEAEEATAQKDGMILNIAINYGGQAEIATAVRAIAQDVKDGALDPDAIDETCIEQRLYTAGQPPVDLILRPSGEYRLSNFLIWQCAYAEYVFDEILWPDFTTADLDRALDVYAGRHRRFGGV
ncbi:MAG: isoprenyl transferase [Clostridia bacterium]|nr:isoprenyl transferase [Clostridia bacterium]